MTRPPFAAVSLTIEGLGTLVGPLIAGVIVATADAGVVFVLGAIAYVASALALAAIRVEGRLRFARQRTQADLTAGIRLVAREPRPRLIVALFVAQTLVRGALNVKFSSPPEAAGSAIVSGIRSGAFIFSPRAGCERHAGNAGTPIHRLSFQD